MQTLITLANAADAEIWRRFVTPEGVLLDYADLDGRVVIPTPEECRESRPNALAWWTPIENGGFFNGLYLDALCRRWRRTGDPADAQKIRRLAAGLRRLAEVADVPGFIARGVATDGQSHHAASSDDQVHPWYLGLERYLATDLPAAVERAAIVELMKQTWTGGYINHELMVPCDGNLRGQTRGSFGEKNFRSCSRYLHILKIMERVTGEPRWQELYRAAVEEVPHGGKLSRREVCAAGGEQDADYIPDIKTQMWIFAGSQAALADLAAWETDPELAAAYRQGLRKTAEFAAPLIAAYAQFAPPPALPFRLHDWRQLEQLAWRPQPKVQDAVKLALEQLKLFNAVDHTRQVTPLRSLEQAQMREPLAAAAIVAQAGGLAPTGARAQIVSALGHYNWGKLHTSLFFFGEWAAELLLAPAETAK